MSYNWCISPRMLSVYTHFSIWIGNQGERLIEPPVNKEKQGCFLHKQTTKCLTSQKQNSSLTCDLPVITFPMEERLGITVNWAGLCGVITLRLVIERQEEGSWLNGIQGHFVYSLAEIFNTSPCPWNSERGGGERVRQFPIFSPKHVSCAWVWLCTCFLQSGQLIWVLLAEVLMCHWGSFETVSQVHWVRGGALQCTATLERNGPCGRRSGVYGQSGAARYLQERVKRRKRGMWKERMKKMKGRSVEYYNKYYSWL